MMIGLYLLLYKIQLDVIYNNIEFYSILKMIQNQFYQSTLPGNCLSSSVPCISEFNQFQQKSVKSKTDENVISTSSEIYHKNIYRQKFNSSPRKSINYTFWTQEQQQQLYYFIIDYDIRNPHFHTSQQSRKQSSYYIDMEKHIKSQLGQQNAKNVKQCKSKHNRMNKSNRSRQIGSSSLDNAVAHIEKVLQKRQADSKTIERFKILLKRYKEFKQTISNVRPYETDINNLLEYSLKVRSRLEEIFFDISINNS